MVLYNLCVFMLIRLLFKVIKSRHPVPEFPGSHRNKTSLALSDQSVV